MALPVISGRELEVLAYIVRRADQEDPTPPTLREIGSAVPGLSFSTVYNYTVRLRAAGLLEAQSGRARTLVPTAVARQVLSCRL